MKKAGRREGVRRYKQYGQMALDVGQTLEIDVPIQNIGLAQILGLVRKCENEDAYELTEKGQKWLKEWTSGQLAAHGQS